jgi:glycerophosphoryl diester phosphodiesterase
MHDDTLDRTTNGRGAVADMPWAEMKALDTGSWFSPAFAGTHITTLVELLLFARENNVQLNLELKPCPGRARATTMVALIEAHKIWPESAPSPLISSFDIESLKIAAQLQPGWPRGLLLDAWREDWQELATVTQASILNVNAEVLTPERQQMFRQSQTPFLAYTVNDPVRAKSLLQGGAQAVFSDDPAALLQ